MSYRLRPALHRRLLNRPTEYRILKLISMWELSHGTLMGLKAHPTTWGWVSYQQLCKLLGWGVMGWSQKEKLRKAVGWLNERGLLSVFHVNAPGNKDGANRYLIPFYLLSNGGESLKAVQETSRRSTNVSDPYLTADGRPPTLKPAWQILGELAKMFRERKPIGA